MKASQINEYGGADKLEINPNAIKPIVGPKQILVQVHASSINPIDLAIRNGYLKDMLPLEFPITLGGDFAGVVSEVGEGVENFKVGDQVYGNASHFKGGTGSWAEYVVANATNAGIKPFSLDYNQAAALPLVGSSAIQALEEHLKLTKDQRILIHGGAGGIGSLAVQLAKHLGAYVVATASTDQVDFVKSLGADQVIDFKTQDFEDLIKDFDAVFDTAGGEVTNKSLNVLRKGGTLVTMSGKPNQEIAKVKEVTALNQMTKISTAQLKRLAELIQTGQLKTQIDKIYPLEQIKEANKYQEQNHPKGKVVINIK
jgi:2-desacetyl-2-hydroxyethyl bacteriochlorophyllide A dehydrogenase